MFNNLSIRAKGVILVMIPLVAQVIFVSALISLLQKAETQIREVEKARVVIAQSTYVMRKVLDATTSAGGFTFTDDLGFRAVTLTSLDEAGAAFKKLIVGVPRDKKNKALIDETKNLIYQWFQMLNGFVARIDRGDRTFLNDAQAFYKASVVVGKLGKNFDKLLVNETRLTEMGTTINEANKRNVLNLLWLGLIGNAVITIFLAFFFARQIGSRLDVLMRKTSRLAAGEPIGDRLCGRDEIARLDKVFHDMADSLNEANHKRAEFVAVVSHELKSPLTAAHGTITLFREGAFGEVSEKADRRLQELSADFSRLIVLINELLDAERIESGNFDLHVGRVKFERVMERALISVGNLSELKKIEIAVANDSGVELKVDEDRLLQVMINLLSNAIKFSPEKSTISVSTEKLDDRVRIVVADNGYGIPEEKVGTIFDRYTRVKRTDVEDEGGSGLGLYISKALVEAMGGSIAVETVVNKGSRFLVDVPRSDSA